MKKNLNDPILPWYITQYKTYFIFEDVCELPSVCISFLVLLFSQVEFWAHFLLFNSRRSWQQHYQDCVSFPTIKDYTNNWKKICFVFFIVIRYSSVIIMQCHDMMYRNNLQLRLWHLSKGINWFLLYVAI